MESPTRYPATRLVMGSSRYAIGAPSLRMTPWRLGFGMAASAFAAVPPDGASERSGLNRFRLAIAPYAPLDRSAVAGLAEGGATRPLPPPPLGRSVLGGPISPPALAVT